MRPGPQALALAGAALALFTQPTHAASPQPPLDRPDDPVVLTGAEAGPLLGIQPSALVGFSYERRHHGKGRWTRIPVQVDERAVVDFGSSPFGAAPSGAATVYGTPPVGAGTLQYTDPDTFVGPDPDPALDGDDEIAFMAADAGDAARRRGKLPKGVNRQGAARVALSDPLDGSTGSVYLFTAKGSGPAAAAGDYVSYDFQLASGDYKATYNRGDGPNPESSTVVTDHYRAGFSDRWMLDSLGILAGGAGGADILDGYKFAFAPGSCVRSEATFDDAEGAFVANIDGPVRAIRSYVGANSGPYTERTNVFYRSSQQIVTDLRVHPIASLFTYYDLSPEAAGMTYANDANPAGVTVDGVDDPVSDALSAWNLWTGSQGSLLTADRTHSSFDAQIAAGSVTGFYEDRSPASFTQCWGDDSLFGAAGTFVVPQGGLPNTDPTGPGSQTLQNSSYWGLGAPGQTTAGAQRWSDRLAAPLGAVATAFKPKRR